MTTEIAVFRHPREKQASRVTKRQSTPSRGCLVEWDRSHLWHPFAQMAEYCAELPIVVERAEGNWLIDRNGKKYLDGVSSLWCNLFGHRHPGLTRVIKDQLDRVAHCTLLGITHDKAAMLARELVRVAPRGLTRVFFSDNGSTAVEVALKMAFQYHLQTEGTARRNRKPLRDRFVSFGNAYHGDTLGSVSVGGIDLFHERYGPLLFKSYRVPAPYCYRCPLGKQPGDCPIDRAEPLEELLRRRHERIAAVLLEPLVQGAAGMLTQPPGFVRRVRELCDQYGVLLILDEVATGFGRTGTLFACEQEKITPDFLCLAKGLTGGYVPLAATLTTEKIYGAFLGRYDEYRTFFHGHTYTGNPLGCAAALETLRIFRQTRVLEEVRAKSEYLRRALAGLASEPAVGEVRQVGLMVGIELVRNRAMREPFPPGLRVGHKVCLRVRKEGILIRPLGDVVVLMPPLSIRLSEIDLVASAVRKSLRSVLRSPEMRAALR